MTGKVAGASEGAGALNDPDCDTSEPEQLRRESGSNPQPAWQAPEQAEHAYWSATAQ